MEQVVYIQVSFSSIDEIPGKGGRVRELQQEGEGKFVIG